MIRRAAVVRVPGPHDGSPLTEEEARGAGPVARLVTAYPWVLDVAVALGVALTGLAVSLMLWQTAQGAVSFGLYPPASPVADTVATTSLVGTLAATVLLLVRRARPLTVTVLLTLACVASLLTAGVTGVLGVALACALGTVAAVRSTTVTWTAFGAVLAVVTVALWRWQDLGVLEVLLWSSGASGPTDDRAGWMPYLEEPEFSPGRRTGSVLLLLVLLLGGLAVGFADRARRVHAADLVERYRALARERDDSAALARAAERAHIAREMHDVVAHSLSVMVALADGADAAFERAPDRSRDAVRQVARTGRSALADMQRVLGALGPVAGDDARRPEPTEVDLATVVERFAAAGVRVTARGLDTPLPADTSVRLAVTRVLAEALTNVLRHAPGATSVQVTVRRTPTAVEVEVVDSGGTRPGDGGGTGRGVVGMRERAALLGGHVEAGPRPEGGWRVHAVLPWCDEDDVTTRGDDRHGTAAGGDRTARHETAGGDDRADEDGGDA